MQSFAKTGPSTAASPWQPDQGSSHPRFASPASADSSYNFAALSYSAACCMHSDFDMDPRSQLPPDTDKQPSGQAHRVKSRRVLACVACQQRKVRCDRRFPCKQDNQLSAPEIYAELKFKVRIARNQKLIVSRRRKRLVEQEDKSLSDNC